jgi:hypothetical protein
MPSIPIIVRERLVAMDITLSEQKLLLRLRHLRKQPNSPYGVLVTASPMTLTILGQLELLEGVAASGSGAYGY